MKNMKKWLALLLLVAVALSLTACGSSKEVKDKTREGPIRAPL